MRIVILSLAMVIGSVALVTVPVTTAQAAEQKVEAKKKTRRTPALRSRVYDQLARAQKLADENKPDEAFAVLDRVAERSSSMNSYEVAMMYNFYAFIHYNLEDYAKATEAFENVVKQAPIPESFEMSTLFSLAQLYMMKEDYDKVVEKLQRWEAINSGKIPAKNYVLKAQAMYQKKDYTASLEYITQAIDLVESDPDFGPIAEEGWYILQRAVFFELKRPEDVKNVLLNKLVKHYNKGKYWIQLGGMYGELENEEKQFAVLEMAYQQGFITKGSDMFNLAQLYYYHGAPYKAAVTMEAAFKSGELEKNLRNVRFLANCWTASKDLDKAIPVLSDAAKLSDTGDIYAQLSQLYLNMDKWDDAVIAADNAIKKGELRQPGVVHLVKGMSFFNQEKYNDALNELAKAEKFKSSATMAKQWQRYVESEKKSAAMMATM